MDHFLGGNGLGPDYMGVFRPFVTIAELKFQSIIWFVILTGLKSESIIWRNSQLCPWMKSIIFSGKSLQNGGMQHEKNGALRFFAVQFASFSSFSIEWNSNHIQAVGGQKEPAFGSTFMFKKIKEQ